MECCLGVFFLMGGFALIITALVMNGIPLGPRILPRTAAIVLGLILLMPMCCGVGGAAGYGGYRGAQIAMKHAEANKGRPMTQAEQQAFQQTLQTQLESEIKGPVTIYYYVIWGLTVVLALIVGLTSTEPRPLAAAAPPPPPSDYGFRAPPPPDGGYKPRDF
jgi:hypothetical protein